GRAYHVAHGLAAEEAQQLDAQWRKKGHLPWDVATYPARVDGREVHRYAVLWLAKDAGVRDARVLVGGPGKGDRAACRPLHKAGSVRRTKTHGDGEDRRHAAVRWQPVQPLEVPAHEFAVDEGAYERTLSPSYLLLDLRLGRNAGRLRTAIGEALSP